MERLSAAEFECASLEVLGDRQATNGAACRLTPPPDAPGRFGARLTPLVGSWGSLFVGGASSGRSCLLIGALPKMSEATTLLGLRQ
jgi:hypothetical protein